MSKKDKRLAKRRSQRFAYVKTRLTGWVTGSHVALTALLILCASVYTWHATGGTWRIFDKEEFCLCYDSLAARLQRGHLDVDRDAISGEALIVNGKSYGYFGFLPAVPRILLDKIWPEIFGRWSRLSVVAAALIHCLFTFLAAAAAFGVAWLESAEFTLHRSALIKGTASVLLMWSVLATLSLSLVFRNEFIWGVDEAEKTHHRSLQRAIESYFHPGC